jgi:two-component system sensor histidine kinase/response regulator
MSRILVIDDEEEFRQVMALTLQRKGFEISQAPNGQRGAELARRDLPDLILCDLNMAPLDGYATLEALRRDPVTATIPFILMTGMGDSDTMRKGMDLGADDFLEKPFNAEKLHRAVNARIRKQQTLRQSAEKKLADLRANLALALPHELMTPLNGIFGLAQLLSTEAETLTPAEVAEFGTTILQSAERLQRIVQNFLLYGQLEVLAADPNCATTLGETRTGHPARLIEDRARHHANLTGRAADLQLALSDSPVAIAPDLFTKLADELIDNAFKFSIAGQPVLITSEFTSRKFTLSVTDGGAGMSPEQVAGLGAGTQFDRQKKEQQGTGFGLAIARRIVELHGGHCFIQSQHGHGTTVTASLPIPFDGPAGLPQTRPGALLAP